VRNGLSQGFVLALLTSALPGCVEVFADNPARLVELKAFELDETEVTVDAYRTCVTAGTCRQPATGSECNWDKPDRGDHPVNCVDWAQATTYCGWVGKRLPTEEEWEAAARGATGRDYPWGNAPPRDQLCWSATSGGHTCPVGKYAAGNTPEGLKDMAGNVWEWTSSNYESEGRVVRGGSWYDSYFTNVHAAYRGKSAPGDRYSALGFRCARTQ
jgi:formylglycine-generating enzyme required for sulfatase activity